MGEMVKDAMERSLTALEASDDDTVKAYVAALKADFAQMNVLMQDCQSWLAAQQNQGTSAPRR